MTSQNEYSGTLIDGLVETVKAAEASSLHECKHCNKPAEWVWTDADGNETSNVCQRCAETVAPYCYSPLYHFTVISTGKMRGSSAEVPCTCDFWKHKVHDQTCARRIATQEKSNAAAMAKFHQGVAR